MTPLIFVYGSLLKGLGNHLVLKRARFVRDAHTTPAFTLVNLGAYPGLLAGGTTAVRGEVYVVDDETLAALDRLEGHPNFYRRRGSRSQARASASRRTCSPPNGMRAIPWSSAATGKPTSRKSEHQVPNPTVGAVEVA